MRVGCLKEGCILEIFLEKYMKCLFFEMLNVTLPFPSICVLLLYCMPVLKSGDQHVPFQSNSSYRVEVHTLAFWSTLVYHDFLDRNCI